MSLFDVATASIAGSAGSLLGDAGSAFASAKQAQKQMDFQEKMSNTAYQRAADDLEAAGLNRILALGSPASTPGGAMGAVPSFGSAMSQGANAAANTMGTAQQISQSKLKGKQIVQETKNLSHKEQELIFKTRLYEALNPYLDKLIQNGFKPLMDQLSDPNFIKNMAQNLMGMPTQAKDAWSKFLSTQMKVSQNIMDNFFHDIEYKWQNLKDRFNKGHGRETSGRIQFDDHYYRYEK